MIKLTEKEMIRDFQNGLYRGFEIAECVHEFGPVDYYVVILVNDLTGEKPVLIDTRRKAIKSFKNINAVIAAVRRIGFRANCLGGR